MSLGDRHQMPLRFSADLKSRLDKMAKARGLTNQAFVLSAVTQAIEDAEGGVEENREKKQRRKDPSRDSSSSIDEPTGLGLNISKRRNEPISPQPQTQPQQGQVVVNVNSSEKNDSISLIDGLATFVSLGPQYNSDDRMRPSVDILKANARNEAHLTELATQLDDSISKRTKSRPSDFEDVKKKAIFAYEKLAEFIK